MKMDRFVTAAVVAAFGTYSASAHAGYLELYNAAASDNVTALRAEIAAGTNVDTMPAGATSHACESALGVAARTGKANAVAALLAAGANPNLTQADNFYRAARGGRNCYAYSNGTTAYDLAIARNDKAMARAILNSSTIATRPALDIERPVFHGKKGAILLNALTSGDMNLITPMIRVIVERKQESRAIGYSRNSFADAVLHAYQGDYAPAAESLVLRTLAPYVESKWGMEKVYRGDPKPVKSTLMDYAVVFWLNEASTDMSLLDTLEAEGFEANSYTCDIARLGANYTNTTTRPEAYQYFVQKNQCD